MQLLLDILLTLGAGILVMLVPGASILALTRIDRIVPAPLVPAAAIALGLVPLTALTAATLALQQPIEWVLAGLALMTVLCWLSLASRVRARAREERRSRRDATQPTRMQSLAEPISDGIFGEWCRGIPALALAAATVAAVIALLSGFHAWNDSLYHIGQAQKLLALDAPSFDNTLQFRDGSAHPGYFIPVWQEVIALVAWIAHVDPVTAAWIIPSITTWIAVLASGGLAWTLTRARGAANVGAIAWVVIAIGTLPFTDAITNGMHPGAVAIHVLMPLVIAMVFVGSWVEPWQIRDDAGPRVTTRAATILAGVATAGIGVLHVSYLWVLGMGVLGYAIVWLLRGPWPRAVVVRHLSVGGTILVVAATCLALLLPGLGRLEQFGRDAKSELAANELGLYAGENGANLDKVVRGGAADDHYHLRADYLVLAGGLALLGLLAIPLALFAPRWPGGWYLLGSATLVLLIALVDRVFPLFVNTVSLDQARRIERVLPLAMGLTMFALFVGAIAARAKRAVAVAVSVAGIALIWLLAETVPPLAGYGGEQIVEPRVLTVLLGILLIGGLCWLVTFAARAGKRPIPLRIRIAQEWSWP
ncbi:MAG: hypothetical protein JWM86_407, partial [Thermoleophilia bacterium]|nr:hypothetical protein [Thermoleophilia bacterium]